MKPQEVLRALADGKVVQTMYGYFRFRSTDGVLLSAPDSYCLYQVSEQGLEEPVYHAIRIFDSEPEPEPKTWRDKSDEDNASAFSAMLIGTPEEQAEYEREEEERQKAKDELLAEIAAWITVRFSTEGIEEIHELLHKAFPEES